MEHSPLPPDDGGVRKSVNIGQQDVEGGVHFHFGEDRGAQPALLRPPRNLPPRQSDTFAGRERELRDLHACFAHEALVGVTQQAAVHSHGGVGKTSLAIEYGWRHLEDYPGGVFFLSCERAPVPPLAELAPYLGIRTEGSAEETAALVKARLEVGAPSLLILDNVEGSDQWLGGRWNRLLPQSPCRRLVTTRATVLAGARMIPLDRLSAEDGLDLLANFREDARQDPQSASAIVEWFDGLAVGLTVVGVYMQMNPALTWKAYADDLTQRGLKTLRDTETVAGEAMEYEGRAGSVFDDVLRALPAVERRALEYAALLPEDNVYAPWLVELLASDGVEVPVLPGYANAPAQHVINTLVSRQLLRPRGEDQRVLGLHRVLRRHLGEQLSGENRSALLGRIETLAERRGKASREVLTDVDVREELTPLAALAEALDEAGRATAGVGLTIWVGESLRLLGRYPEALALVDRVVGSPSQDAARPVEATSLLSNSALILKDLGELPEARRRMEQAIAIQEHQFHPDHPMLATSYSNLAMILKDQGDLPEARHRMEQAIAIDEKHRQPDDIILAIGYSNLATILHDQGELLEARRRMEQAITIEEHQFDPEHPTLATSYSNLAMILRDQGELPKARHRLEQAIAIWEQYLHSDHPTLATSYSNLATILQQQGELPEAHRRMKQAIAIEERHFHPDHPTLAISYNNLGTIEQASGDTASACALYRRADAILRKHFPPEHPHRQIISKHLATVCGEA